VKLTSNRSEVVVVALIGLLAVSWKQLSRIEGDLTRGPYPPPRNAVESGRKHGNL
jgi:hypothetical protein